MGVGEQGRGDVKKEPSYLMAITTIKFDEFHSIQKSAKSSDISLGSVMTL